MATKFSEDVIPLTNLKTNPGRVVKRLAETRRPALLTSRGRGVAVVQSLAEYERQEEEREFMRGVLQGLSDLESGREFDLSAVRKRLGIR